MMKIEKVKRLVTNLHDQTEYVIHVGNLKQVLSHGLVLNTKLRKKVKNNSESDFFKLMNNAVFGKAMENVRKHRDIKLVTTEMRRDYLVSEPNYYTAKFFTKNLLAIEIRKTEKLRYL